METYHSKRHNPYRVPEGYFSELRNNIREQISADVALIQEPQVRLWVRVKSIAGFVAAFGCLVLFATIGYYFTGYQAQQRESSTTDEAVLAEALMSYQFTTEELEVLEQYVMDSPSVNASEEAQFAEDVTAYLDTYGYGAYFEAALNGEEPY